MKKPIILAGLTVLCVTAQAEWFEVQSVNSYNQIVASRPDTPANSIKIRIRNLENIEDIQMDRTKVLFSGKSTMELAQKALKGQLVWIEDLKEDSGIYVGTIYLSYEQMVRAFAEQRMVGGQTVPEDVKRKIQDIAKRMLTQLNSSKIPENDTILTEAYNKALSNGRNGNSYFSFGTYYKDEYLRGIFAYEALNWFKQEGQFLPAEIQSTFVDWLSKYQSVGGDAEARLLEIRIRDMTVRYELYKDFLF